MTNLKPYCNHGHALTGDNLKVRTVTTNQKHQLSDGTVKTYSYTQTRYECRICRNKHRRDAAARHKAKLTPEQRRKEKSREYWRHKVKELNIDRKA